MNGSSQEAQPLDQLGRRLVATLFAIGWTDEEIAPVTGVEPRMLRVLRQSILFLEQVDLIRVAIHANTARTATEKLGAMRDRALTVIDKYLDRTEADWDGKGRNLRAAVEVARMTVPRPRPAPIAIERKTIDVETLRALGDAMRPRAALPAPIDVDGTPVGTRPTMPGVRTVAEAIADCDDGSP